MHSCHRWGRYYLLVSSSSLNSVFWFRIRMNLARVFILFYRFEDSLLRLSLKTIELNWKNSWNILKFQMYALRWMREDKIEASLLFLLYFFHEESHFFHIKSTIWTKSAEQSKWMFQIGLFQYFEFEQHFKFSKRWTLVILPASFLID